jgi:beta-carotene ketolase (CrtW type)
MEIPRPDMAWVVGASRRPEPTSGKGLADFAGVAIGLSLIIAWLACVGGALLIQGSAWPVWFGFGLVLLNTLLSTGLFITAHDAMHGLVAPGSRSLNAAIGQLALGLYAGFDFEALRRAHQQHHLSPASADDPDYHDGRRTSFGAWYLRFMRHYLSVGQVVRMAVLFNLLVHALGVSEVRCLVYWLLPTLLSTAQLFYFGTYRAHRKPAGGYVDAHCATSHDLPVWLSLLTCFHFGYHHEHHDHAHLPWWKLPAARARAVRGAR